MKTEFTISKHRFYELKHFCLQYPDWIKIYTEADGWTGRGDTTSKDGIKRADIIKYVELIDSCVYEIGVDIKSLIITPGIIIPQNKMFDYRRFFWLLSRRR